jgi:hypothetical protein
MSLKNKKDSEQECERSKSDKDLAMLSEPVPMGFWPCKAAEKASTPNREQGYSHLSGNSTSASHMSQKDLD